ncbi:MAG: cobalamin-binding protein [bacterium]
MRYGNGSAVARVVCLAWLLWAPLLLWTGIALGEVLVDQAGRRVDVPVRAQRVVSLAPSITECLFALGLDQEVVGVTEFSNYPPEAASRPSVGSYVRINTEAVVSLRPDLVIATRDGNPAQTVALLSDLGLTVYVVDPRDMDGLFATLESLGRIFGRGHRAEEIVRELAGRMERLERVLAGRARPRVFMQIGAAPLMTVGAGTLQNQLIALAGGENIAEGDRIPYPIVSMERVLDARPEVILICTLSGPSGAERQMAEWLRWTQVPAVASGRIHPVNGDLIARPTPRILEGIEELACKIHPEVAALLQAGPDAARRGDAMSRASGRGE